MRHQRFPLMLFAAGFGTRMRHLTADRPKPLIPVAGRPLIDRALDLAREAGAGPIVVNTHYRGAQIAAHLAGAADVAVSDEPGAILETGGGLRQALPLLGNGPVMTLNPDAVWHGENPLRALARAWDGTAMDALLLVQDAGAVKGRAGRPDFTLAPDGRIARAAGSAAGVVYLGAQILRTEGLAAVPETVFSLNVLWDRMIAEGRAYGLPYTGDWCDVGSPEGLSEAEAMLAGKGAA